MSLKEVLQNDWKEAVKAKDKLRANTISMAKAAILQVEKSGGASSVTDEDVVEILAREVKQRRESIEEFKKGNRDDLVEVAEKEIEILLEYLPKQLTRDEILEFIRQAALEVGANGMSDMGRVMSVVVPRVKGRADGKVVSTLVKELLNN